jgi:hypothetical protein
MRWEVAILETDPTICQLCYVREHGCTWADIPEEIKRAHLAEYCASFERSQEQRAAYRAAWAID